MHGIYLRSLHLGCCLKPIIPLRGVVPTTVTGIHNIFIELFIEERYTSQNLEEKGIVMNKGCALTSGVCIGAHVCVCVWSL